MNNLKNTLLLLFIGMIVLNACKDDVGIARDNNLTLAFTIDTLSFDTVFTTIGSVTKRFTVNNTNSNAIELSSVVLASRKNSPFRLNINGKAGNSAQDILILPNDSIYIFVEVTVDPNRQNLPVLVHDSIVFNWNGNNASVHLVAYGQDVHLLDGEKLKTGRWQNDKPYLIKSSVMVDGDETLIIDPGCRIHFNAGSSLFVQGTLKVNGNLEEPVCFQGGRLEQNYSDVPGQWGATRIDGDNAVYFGGIHFLKGSKENTMDYAIIRNGTKGVQVDSLGASEKPVLTLSNTIIENMSMNCLDARTSSVRASNCIFTNSGSATVRLLFGGEYEFIHCTMANYFGAGIRKTPVIYVTNHYKIKGVQNVFDFDARFYNCMVYGDLRSELYESMLPGKDYHHHFLNCLLKLDLASGALGNAVFEKCLFNMDPRFKDVQHNELNIDALSPARNAAEISVSKRFPTDLKGISRLDDQGPDIGALEWQEMQEATKFR